MAPSVHRALRALLNTLLAFAALATGAVAAGLLYRAWMQHRIAREQRIVAPGGVESLERVTLGGVRQWILIRGWDRTNPVLLYVHGGPGFPETAVARLFCSELERHFVVVLWDQRGAGKSYQFGLDRSSFTIQRYVDDMLELIQILRGRFHAERIYLVGHSWGTVLGVLTARDHPKLLHAYVGIGQVVNWLEQERISYRFVVQRAEEEKNQKAVAELATLHPPYEDPNQMWVERKWLSRYRGDFYDGGGMRRYVLAGAFSPHYSLLDGLRFILGTRSVQPMWRNEIQKIDLMRSAPHLDVPIYFFEGRRDYNTPFELVERYYEQLEAPRKEIVWFERSAHSPNLEEPELFQSALVSRVLSETYRR